MSGPARGYSWPTATPGNKIALKHGFNSPEAIAETAEELRPRRDGMSHTMCEIPSEPGHVWRDVATWARVTGRDVR